MSGTYRSRQVNPPGATNRFRLDSHGDEVYLFSADIAGNLTGYSDGFAFPASENGVSFGRQTNSVGDVLLTPQVFRTFGAANSGPRIGPVVFNEIRYAPAVGFEEFVELRNLAGTLQSLLGHLRNALEQRQQKLEAN